jgi:hypothetical protein
MGSYAASLLSASTVTVRAILFDRRLQAVLPTAIDDTHLTVSRLMCERPSSIVGSHRHGSETRRAVIRVTDLVQRMAVRQIQGTAGDRRTTAVGIGAGAVGHPGRGLYSLEMPCGLKHYFLSFPT